MRKRKETVCLLFSLYRSLKWGGRNFKLNDIWVLMIIRLGWTLEYPRVMSKAMVPT